MDERCDEVADENERRTKQKDHNGKGEGHEHCERPIGHHARDGAAAEWSLCA